MSAFDRTAPMRRDTILRLASVTKPSTAVAAMILVEGCKLRLDEAVDAFLPELANREALRTIDSEFDDPVPAKRSITLRDLLTFRSGYGEVAFLSPLQVRFCEGSGTYHDNGSSAATLSIVTRRDDVAGVAGRYGWDTAFSTSLDMDPNEEIVGVLVAQRRPGALRLPPVIVDFWTSAYQAIDD